MAEFGDRLALAEVILGELSRGSFCRTELEKRVFRVLDISRTGFDFTFSFLVSDGDVEKVSDMHRAPFRLTEKGKRFLAWRVGS